MPVIRCQAIEPDDEPRCQGFVAWVPYPIRFQRLVENHESADRTSLVVPCQSCKTLHELAPEWTDKLREAA